MRTALVLLTAITITAAVHAQTPVKAAFMYCSWPNGQASFKDEFDGAFKTLGWQATKFENTQAQELSARLGEFDLVVGGGVSNLDHPQDFSPYAAQWQAFLKRGGVVIATDASYGGINGQWIGGIDPALKTTSAICSAHSKPSAETLAVKFAEGDPLLSIPHPLEPDLTPKSCWAHLDNVGEGWTTAVTCHDGKPLLIHRPYGQGLVVVTSYFRFSGSSGGAATHLLQNALTLARLQQRGLGLRAVSLPTQLALGDNTLSLTVANTGAEATPVTVRLDAKQGDRTATAESATPLAAGQEATVPLTLRLSARGAYEGTLTLKRGEETLLTLPRPLSVPELVVARPARRHVFADRPQMIANVTLAPELRDKLAQLRVTLQPVGTPSGETVTLRPTALEATRELSVAKLPAGPYELLATLHEGDRKLADWRAPFTLHPRPQVYFNDRNVCFVDDKPFFPIAMYHVAWRATKEQMLQCVEDLAAMGFNAVHTSCTNLDNFQEVLDRAQARGLKVIPEGIGAKSPALARFKDHPAILAWNSGDEPDCANVAPEQVGANIDAVRDTDATHPLYTTVANPGVLLRYAPHVDVFSNDPYPITRGKTNTIAVALQTAQAREAVQHRKPLWMVPQCFGYPDGPWDVPTPAQERSMSYQALIEGANGLNWYVYDDVKFKLMDHPELVAMMKRLTGEVRTLTPFLLDPAYDAARFQAGPEGCIRACAIKDGNTLLIMAAHTNEKDLGAQELTVPGLPAGAAAEVMFEQRRIDTAGGKITDTFGPYAVHVYRVRL